MSKKSYMQVRNYHIIYALLSTQISIFFQTFKKITKLVSHKTDTHITHFLQIFCEFNSWFKILHDFLQIIQCFPYIWKSKLQNMAYESAAFFLHFIFFPFKCTVLIYVLLHFVCDLCILYATLQLIKFRTTNVFLNIDHGTRFQMLHDISKFLYSNCLVHLCYHTLSNISQQFA